MSLDVYLKVPGVQGPCKCGAIFVRENGGTVELTREEWDRRYPGREPFTVDLPSDDEYVFEANITHNLNRMAAEAGIYEACWRPDEIGAERAKDIVPLLEKGLADMKARPSHFEQFNAPNGWGMYEHFVPWVEQYLEACREYPDAEIEVSR